MKLDKVVWKTAWTYCGTVCPAGARLQAEIIVYAERISAVRILPAAARHHFGDGSDCQTIPRMNITLSRAQVAVQAALSKAIDIEVKMNIAVVDSGANLVGFARQDGAWLGSTDIAIKKAKTAVLFQMPSADIGKLSQPGEPLYGIELSNGGLISFGGGIPIMDGDTVIGAIGVSGGTVTQDIEVATAGLEALGQ